MPEYWKKMKQLKDKALTTNHPVEDDKTQKMKMRGRKMKRMASMLKNKKGDLRRRRGRREKPFGLVTGPPSQS